MKHDSQTLIEPDLEPKPSDVGSDGKLIRPQLKWNLVALLLLEASSEALKSNPCLTSSLLQNAPK